jgi:hypothetical protein
MGESYKLVCDGFFRYILTIFELLSCRTKPGYQSCNDEEPEEVYFKEPIKRKF